jgi:hypothetical protein
VVDQGHQPPVLADEEGVVPADPEVGVEAETDPTAEAAVGGGEVEVPRLVPQRLGPRLVPPFVVTR